MKKNILIMLFCLVGTNLFAQQISNDGKYVAIINKNSNLIIKATNSPWHKEIKDVLGDINFSSDGKNLIFQKKDTLFIFRLSTDILYQIPNVITWKLPKSGKGQWLAYQLTKPVAKLVIRNLYSNVEQEITNVTDYSFNELGNALLANEETKTDHRWYVSLKWLNLTTNHVATIWSSVVSDLNEKVIKTYAISSDGTRVAFILIEKNDQNQVNTIWYYENGKTQADVLVGNNSLNIGGDFAITTDQIHFSEKGAYVFFTVKKDSIAKPNKDLASVDVWSYTDTVLQSQQLIHLMPRHYWIAISIEGRHITRLEYENENIVTAQRKEEQVNDNYAIICRWRANMTAYAGYSNDEYNWNKAQEGDMYLIHLKTGTRKLLKENEKPRMATSPYYQFSPLGKYIIYYDQDQKSYNSFNLENGQLANLTKTIPVGWTYEVPDGHVSDYYKVQGIWNWRKDDAAFFVWDHYHDLWELDPTGKKEAVNITCGFAKEHNIGWWQIVGSNSDKPIVNDNKIIFRSIDKSSQDECFYELTVNKANKPRLLFKGPFRTRIFSALNSDTFILQRESSESSLQSFYSMDFRNLINIDSSHSPDDTTYIHQKIIFWKTFDTTSSEGVLLYPRQFDVKKKYPVILNYYEDMATGWFNSFHSNKFNSNIPPPLPSANIDVSYCLNNGYFVFIPNIHYHIGQSGESAYNAVVSGAEYIAKLPFIDSTKMGICGHSFGGYETNYIISHSHLFAAACSGSGLTDLISLYGAIDIDEAGYLNAGGIETGQVRLGVTPWERIDLYIKNSPIFYADKITTPLLMMDNKNDRRVPPAQGIELFKAMRRLGKIVWLCQYDAGVHWLTNGNDLKDWGTREMQFFDYYLKNASAPIWMTRGIPADLKQVDAGLKYDEQRKAPPSGIMMDKEIITPNQDELNKHHTTVNAEGRIIDKK